MAGFSKAKTSQDDKPKLTEEVQLIDWSMFSGEYAEMRVLGPIIPYMEVWIPIITKSGKEIKIPKIIGGFDPIDNEIVEEQPYYTYAKKNDYQISKRWLFNAIVYAHLEEGGFPGKRSASEKTPHEFDPKWECDGIEFFFKDSANKASRTPVRVIRVPNGVAAKINNLEQFNKVKIDGKVRRFPVDDPDHGATFNLSYNAKAAPIDKYDVQQGERNTPLTDEDLGFLIYDITNLQSLVPDSVEEQERQIKQWEDNRRRADGEDVGDDEPPRSRRRQPKDDQVWGDEEKPATGRAAADDDDEDETPPPRRSRKARPVEDDDIPF